MSTEKELFGLRAIVEESMPPDVILVMGPAPQRDDFIDDEEYEFACEVWARKSLGLITNVS